MAYPPKSKTDFDARWKHIIEQLVNDFLLYFLPVLHADTDWRKEVISGDKELQKIFPQANRKGRRFPDKLLQVPLLIGDTAYVVVHIEVEGTDHADMAERMFRYLLPLWEKFPQKIATLVIYTGKRAPVKFGVFEYERYGTKIKYEFNTFKVCDQKEEDLLKSENPFALVILACLYNIRYAAKSKVRYLLRCKQRLAELCFEKNYTEEQLSELLIFVQWAMALPAPEEEDYIQTVHHLIEKNMDTRPLIEQNKRFSDLMLKYFIGKTSDELMSDWNKKSIEYRAKIDFDAEIKAQKEAEKAQKEIEKAQKEIEKAQKEAAKAQKEIEKAQKEAEKAAKAAKEKEQALLQQFIWQMHLVGKTIPEIAKLTNTSEAVVKKTIALLSKTNKNGAA